jgi:hypothetical protein
LLRSSTGNYLLIRQSNTAADIGLKYVKSTDPNAVSAEIRFDGFSSGTLQGGIQIFTRVSGSSLQKVADFQPDGDLVPGANSFSDTSGFGLGATNARWREAWVRNLHFTTATNDSDRRLKTDITILPYGLEAILALKPSSFRWLSGDERVHFGLMAQDVQDVMPQLVYGDEADGDTLSLASTELIPVLIKAIQEQQQEIDELRGGTLLEGGPSRQDSHPGVLLDGLTLLCIGLAGTLGVTLWRRTS